MTMISLRPLATVSLSLCLLGLAAPEPAAAAWDSTLPQAGVTTAAQPTPKRIETARRGRGADDGPGHQRGGKRRGRGADDGPNHG